MNNPKQRLKFWFDENFHLIRNEQSVVTVQPKSLQGCLLIALPLLLLVLAFVGCSIFISFKIHSLVFSIFMTRLGIAPWLGFPLIIAAFFGCFINLPLFILTMRHRSKQLGSVELLPLWLFKVWCLPSYKVQHQAYGYVGLNISGGLIPIILALYQFHRVSPLAILMVTAIVGLMSYYLVVVIPGACVFTGFLRLNFIMAIAALSAMISVAGGTDRFDVSVAYAGGVLGTTIGADLLHLKDLQLKKATDEIYRTLSIGGAGLEDGIWQCGLGALVMAEWLPAVVAWFR